MIPEKLQDCLIEELKSGFKDIKYKNLKGELTEISVYKQNLPSIKYEEQEENRFPCIVVELKSGETAAENEKQTCKVNFIIGTVNAICKENDGKINWEGNDVSAVFSIINKITEIISEEGLFNNYNFEFQYPINWDVVDDETDPFSYGSVESNWNVPGLVRKNKETAQWL